MDSKSESKLLMIIVDCFQDRIVKAATVGEARPTPQERVEYYGGFLADLSGGDRIKLFLARLALVGEGADPASVTKAAIDAGNRTDSAVNSNMKSNHNRILQNLSYAVDQLIPMAVETVSDARNAKSTDDQTAIYLRHMLALAANIRLRFFLVRSTLMAEGADKTSVDAAATEFGNSVALE